MPFLPPNQQRQSTEGTIENEQTMQHTGSASEVVCLQGDLMAERNHGEHASDAGDQALNTDNRVYCTISQRVALYQYSRA